MPGIFEAETYISVLENLTTGVCVADRDGRIQFWNDGVETITGYLRLEMIGRSCNGEPFVHRDEANTVLYGADSPLAATAHDGRKRTLDLFLVHKEGHCVPVRVRTAPVRDARGTIVGAAESLDVLALMPEADVYSHLSGTRDSLTGILDQTSFDSYLAATIEDFQRDLVPFGVLNLSIDQLGDIRRRQGVIAAQSTLRAAAQTLAKGMGPFDVAGRCGEDTLAAIVTPCPAAYLEAVALKFQRIAGRVSVPWWGDHLSISISVGGTEGRETDTVDSLMARSQEALETKSTGGRRVAII